MPHNALTGPIPSELGNLDRLEILSLGLNQLTGSIPPEIGQMAAMRRFSLSSNALSGSIPSELGQLTRLEAIWLHENQLTGEIPPELGNLESLVDLLLPQNRLSGSVPAELARATKLKWLDVVDNPSLEGTIAAFLSQPGVNGTVAAGDRGLHTKRRRVRGVAERNPVYRRHILRRSGSGNRYFTKALTSPNRADRPSWLAI